MVVLLQQAGVTRAAASAGTLLVRLVTLWFAVVIGLAALAWLHRRQRVEDPAFHGSSQGSSRIETGIETIGVAVASSPGGAVDASVLQNPS
jgi:putative copper export protein